MSFFRRGSSSSIPSIAPFQPELRVIRHIATPLREGGTEPQIRMSAADAHLRMLTEGELAWVQGPRGQQLAEVVIDDEIPEHDCVVRDLPGVVVSEMVRVVKPDLDSPKRG
jgi:anaerobic selenocysteine-containing dehydrogenase